MIDIFSWTYIYFEWPAVYLLLQMTFLKLFPGRTKTRSLLFFLISGILFIIAFYILFPMKNYLMSLSPDFYILMAIILFIPCVLVFLEGRRATMITDILYYFAFYKAWKNMLAPFYRYARTSIPANTYILIEFCSVPMLIALLMLEYKLFLHYADSFRVAVSNRTAIIGMFFPIAAFIICYLPDPFHSFPAPEISAITAVCLLICLPLLYYLIASALSAQEEKDQLNRALDQSHAQISQLRLNAEAEETVRKERHEIKNKYFYLHTLLQEKKYDEADKYIMDVTHSIDEHSGVIHTGNLLVDHILSMKIAEARQHHIPMFCDVLLPAELSVNEESLAAILLNLLNNAIEAEMKEEKPDIHIAMVCRQYHLVCRISNHTSHDVLKENPHLLTTKQNQREHGLGTKIVKDTVKRENGLMSVKTEGNEFVVTISLPLE